MTVLIDVDHVLADSFWRDQMLDGAERWNGWDAYHAASIDDAAIVEMVELANALRDDGHFVIGITVRPGKWRQLTLDWMMKHRVKLDGLLMRDDDDYRSSRQIKMELAATRLNFGVDLVIDDNEEVCEAFRAAGVTTLKVDAKPRGRK